MVPVLPKGELEVLLEAAVDLSKKGKMSKSHMKCDDVCQVCCDVRVKVILFTRCVMQGSM